MSCTFPLLWESAGQTISAESSPEINAFALLCFFWDWCTFLRQWTMKKNVSSKHSRQCGLWKISQEAHLILSRPKLRKITQRNRKKSFSGFFCLSILWCTKEERFLFYFSLKFHSPIFLFQTMQGSLKSMFKHCPSMHPCNIYSRGCWQGTRAEMG